MRTIILLLSTLFIFVSCDKDNDKPQNPIDQLPSATQTGANTFGCLINGEPFVVSNTSQQTAIYQGGILQIGGGIDSADKDISVSIILENPLNINTNYLLANFPIHSAKFRKREGAINCNYNYEDTYQGKIILTNIDTVNYIVSGTFEFSTFNENCQDIKITDGRFDLQYIP